MAENSNINSPNDGLSLSSPVSYSSKENNDIEIYEFGVIRSTDKDIDIVEVFDGILANLHERYGDKLLLGDKVLMSQAGMHG